MSGFRGHPGQQPMGQTRYIPSGSGVVRTVVDKGVVQPSKDFAYGIFKGKPKYIRLNESGATTADITPFVRAGMQTRYLVAEGSKLAFFKTPRVFYGTAKYLVRSTVRDTVITPFYSKFYVGFQASKVFTQATGRVRFYDRAGDAIFRTTNRYLNTVGLAPTLKGALGSYARYAAGATIYFGAGYLGDATDAIYATSRKYLDDAKDTASRNLPNGVPGGRNVYIPSAPSSPQVAPPSVVLPIPSPPVSPNAPPPPNRRRYIPAGD